MPFSILRYFFLLPSCTWVAGAGSVPPPKSICLFDHIGFPCAFPPDSSLLSQKTDFEAGIVSRRFTVTVWEAELGRGKTDPQPSSGELWSRNGPSELIIGSQGPGVFSPPLTALLPPCPIHTQPLHAGGVTLVKAAPLTKGNSWVGFGPENWRQGHMCRTAHYLLHLQVANA